MIAATEFKLDTVQLTGFVTTEELSPARGLRLAQRAWGDDLDGEVVSIPSQAAIPADVPTAIISSASQSQRIEIARSRVNLFIGSTNNQPVDFDAAAAILVDRLFAIGEDSGVTFGRLAVLTTKFLHTSEPAKKIAAHFFKEQFLEALLNRPNTLEVHSHKVFALKEDLQVNSWVRVRSAQLKETLDFVISLDQDLNTLEEERAQWAFSADEILEFVNLVGSEHDHIARLYFPVVQPETRA